MPRRRVRPAALLVAAAAAATLVAIPPATAAEPEIVTRDVMITAHDGVQLSARIAEPATGGPYPLVVQPGTFAAEAISTHYIGEELARRGYVTVGYIERGLGSSGGKIDGGGPLDRADVSTAIDWGIANSAKVDPERIGVAGLSYGGGIALQAAAFDDRIDAVVNISGWVDLANAVYQNGTRVAATLGALQLVGSIYGRFSAEALAAIEAGQQGTDIETALAWARARSATSWTDRYRRRAPALFMSHSMNETLAPIDATMAFFEAYPGPKHEDLRAGDHGTQEILTPFGITPVTWQEAYRWLDAWLKDADTGIRDEPAVLVVPRSSGGARPAERYATTAVRRTERVHLATEKQLLGGTRTTLAAAPGRASQQLEEGENWVLHVPVPEFSYTGELVTGRPIARPLAWIDRRVTGVWTGDRIRRTTQLRGEAKAHLRITPTAEKGTIQVYVLDVDATDTAYIIAQVPYTFRGATPGQPLEFDVRTPYNAYDLTPSHRLAVAVSTGDTTYASENPEGATMTVDPGSWVDVPLR